MFLLNFKNTIWYHLCAYIIVYNKHDNNDLASDAAQEYINILWGLSRLLLSVYTVFLYIMPYITYISSAHL